tara:strand:- start:2978 stop:3538 length:561 start_codon:yes stop_codon:yes gene_type:complete
MPKRNKTHLIINNFFTEPDKIVAFALKQKFYNKETHPDKKAMLAFPGHRTEFLHIHKNKKMYNKISSMLSKAAQLFLEKDDFKAKLRIAFSYTDKDVYMPQFHTDNDELKGNTYDHAFAGVVYLNKDAPLSAGTIVVVNNKGFKCSNEYNKLFMYDSNLKHSGAGTFGKNKKDSRLVLTFYFGVFK